MGNFYQTFIKWVIILSHVEHAFHQSEFGDCHVNLVVGEIIVFKDGGEMRAMTTKQLIYNRLLKLFPGGLTLSQLRKRVPQRFRGQVKDSLRELILERVVNRKGKVYVINTKMA